MDIISRFPIEMSIKTVTARITGREGPGHGESFSSREQERGGSTKWPVGLPPESTVMQYLNVCTQFLP